MSFFLPVFAPKFLEQVLHHLPGFLCASLFSPHPAGPAAPASHLLSIGLDPAKARRPPPSGAQWLWCLRWHSKPRSHLDTQRAAAAPKGALTLELWEMGHHRTNKEGSEREKEKHPHKCSQRERCPKEGRGWGGAGGRKGDSLKSLSGAGETEKP